MLMEAVSLGVPWTAQRRRISVGFVQRHYPLEHAMAHPVWPTKQEADTMANTDDSKDSSGNTKRTIRAADILGRNG
jgi:hypothetical protein